MTDPTSTNILLAEPTRGSDADTWDVPMNLNASALDGMIGGQTTISLSAGTSFALGAPATGVVSAAAGPNQSWNAVIKLTGTMLGNSSMTLSLPKKYVFDTTGLTMGTSFVQIQPASGTGTRIGLPPGEKTELWYDGTNVDFVNLGRVGSYLDLAVTTTPLWMQGCTKQPYLPCDGTIYTSSLYPVLGSVLGSTFGGNGITTFGVPDAGGRVRAMLNAGTGRLTVVNGNALGSVGGNENPQSHNHGGVVTNLSLGSFQASGNGVGGAGNTRIMVTGPTGNDQAPNYSDYQTVAPSGTIPSAGTGGSQNVQPTYIGGVTFIKT